MSLLRHYDEATGTLGCAGKDCDYEAVQTIKMAAVPWSREGDKILSSHVRYEFVGICEGHLKVHFKERAQLPTRFIAGRET